MPVIDVDSHYYEPFDWLERTAPDVAAEVPKVDKVTLVLTTAFGEVLSTLPPEVKPDPYSRIPKQFLGAEGVVTPEVLARGEFLMEGWISSVQGGHKAADRIAFLDAQGIDLQFILPTFAFNPISHIRREKPELLPRLLQAYNSWAFDNVDGYTDRLLPVVVVDLKTMERETVISELKTSRERGARSFLFWPSPAHGKSLTHPDFDWLWGTAADLGIMPMVHVGASRPALDMGWLNNGREFPSQLIAYFGQLQQIPEILLSELLGAGTFERHPALRVLVCELGIDWLPTFVRRADRLAKGAGEAWTMPHLPSEYLRRQVRVSPLHTDPTAHVIEEVGEGMVVFSSDYPHPEGGSDATNGIRSKLVEKSIDQATIDAFMGGTIAADLAATA
jgi:predicted TIM-barrel fold metal-dependent hydrolase